MMTYRIKRILNLTAVLFLLTGFGISSAQAAPSDHFVTTWKTDNPGQSNNSSITVPMRGGPYDVDWDNDGTFDELWLTGPVTHDFGVPGTYTIRIDGSYQRIDFSLSGDQEKIVALDQWGTQAWISMIDAFTGCSNLEIPATDTPDLLDVWSVRNMFYGATLANPDTSGWDTSSITDMNAMFLGAASANPDTSGWDTSSVKYMVSMFEGAIAANPDTSGWDTSAVTRMEYLFAGATSANPDTRYWDTSAVTNMNGMFSGATAANPDTSGWNTSAVTSMDATFEDATSANPDTSGWDTSSVISMSDMFYRATSANPDTSGWDTSSVLIMDYMFYQATAANPDTSGWDTSSVNDMRYMFSGATSANPDTSGWDTSSVRQMRSMFSRATSANPDTSGWDMSAVTNTSLMFYRVTLSRPNYEALLVNWNTQALQPGLAFDGGYSTYCSSAAANARANMINADGWTITDGGQDCAGQTSPPTVVTSPASNIGQTSARLNGSANPNGASTNAWFQWGTSTAYGNTTSQTNVGSGTSPVSYNFNLSALACGTTYHFRAVAQNSGGTAYGIGRNFTTSACATPPPTVVTSSASSISASGARLNGSADPNGASTNAWFQWGTSTAYGNTTSQTNVGSGTSPVSYNFNLSALACGTTYHFRAMAQNSGGTAYGIGRSFTTSACSTPPPTVVTSSANFIGQTAARLRGSADPNGASTNAWFQWGTSTAYGNVTSPQTSVGSGTSPVSYIFNLSALACDTTYHFRAVASNNGGTAYGTDGSFTTSACSPPSAPDIAVSGSGNFGNVDVGTSSTHTFSVSNTGNADLIIGDLNGLATPFSVVSDICSGVAIAPDSSCTLSVRFAPVEIGLQSDTLIIPSNDPDQPNVNIPVSGTGTAVPVPNIAVSGSGAFGEVEVDTTSNRSFSISNSGNAALNINSIGGLAAPFSIVSNNCGSSLAAGTSCTFNVQFAPTEATGETDTVVINSDDPDQPNVYIPVSGTGTAVPVPNIAVSGSGAFGEVEVDTTSNRSFSISNSGNAALNINSIGGLAAPFSIVSNNCGSSLAAGTSCTFNVQFAPTEATGETDTVVINSDDPDQPNVYIPVSGTGTAVPVPNIAVSGSGAFGEVEVDTTSNRSFSISNSGNAALNINSIGGLAAPFSIVSNNCGSSLAAGTSCTFNVQFAPTEATGDTDTVVINSDDPDQPNVYITVSGTGTAVPVPNIAVSGSGAFGEVEVDTTSNRSFSISNSGNAALNINSIGGLAAPFSIVSNNCGSSLATGTSCTFNVQFAPTEATGDTDTVVINSDDPDQPNVYIPISGTGIEAPPQGEQVEIISTGFEDGNANDWILDGGIDVNGTEAIGQYSLRHRKSATSVLNVSTVGYSGVNVTMHLAGTALEPEDNCYAEVSTNDGASWSPVVEVHDGIDDGTFHSATVSPPGAGNNSNLKLRFRSTGQHKPDYCWGDDVTVLGTPIGDNDIFTVYKDFSDNNAANVSISLSCSSGIVTNNPQLASEEMPAVFIIEGATNGTTCTAIEESATSGYTADESDCQDDDPLNGFCTIVNNLDAPPDDVVIVDAGFEDEDGDGYGDTGNWVLNGSVVDGTLAIDQFSLRHEIGTTSELSVSTAGYTGVSVKMHLAATALKQNGGCYAEVSTDGGSSWTTVVEVLKGNDDGTFMSNTESLTGIDDNVDLQLRFRADGKGNGGYCYGDDITVSGTLN